MLHALSERDKKTIQDGLLQTREMYLRADDLVGWPNLQPILEQLYDRLSPFCDPPYLRAEIALHLGNLQERFGNAFLEKGTFPLEASYYFFDGAAVYFKKAAAIVSTSANRLAPSHAKIGLSQLYEAGFIGSPRAPDLQKSFGLIRLAAQEGLSQAQLSLAFAYFEGHGTKKSLSRSVLWINAAYDSRAQLDEVTCRTVEKAKEIIETFFLETAPQKSPRDRMLALQRARSGSSFLETRTLQ